VSEVSAIHTAETFIGAPGVGVSWLTLLIRIPKMPGSNLGLEPDSYVRFSSASPVKWQYLRRSPRQFLSASPPAHYWPTALSFHYGVENVGASTSHSPLVLHGLLQGQIYFLPFSSPFSYLFRWRTNVTVVTCLVAQTGLWTTWIDRHAVHGKVAVHFFLFRVQHRKWSHGPASRACHKPREDDKWFWNTGGTVGEEEAQNCFE
jgi:hypothetical protein